MAIKRIFKKIAQITKKGSLKQEQSDILAFKVSFALCIIFIIIQILNNSFHSLDNILIGGIAFPIIIFMATFSVLNSYFCKPIIREIDVNIEEDKTKIKKYLSHTDFTEVYLNIDYKPGDITNMLIDIIETERCRFYAKLSKNDNIIIIAKNQKYEDIYWNEISNPIFFTTYFKFDNCQN